MKIRTSEIIDASEDVFTLMETVSVDTFMMKFTISISETLSTSWRRGRRWKKKEKKQKNNFRELSHRETIGSGRENIKEPISPDCFSLSLLKKIEKRE